MTTMKKRGRPPSAATLENRRAKDLLQSISPHMTPAELAVLKQSYAHDEEIRQEILSKYKHGTWTPDEHAYKMASLGDESLHGHEQQVLDDDARYNRIAKKIRVEAGKTVKNVAQLRRESVLQKNRVLIARAGSIQAYNRHKVATIIHGQWKTIAPGHRLVGEDQNMSGRGDGGEPVSIRTIERWLEQGPTFFDRPGAKKNLQQ